MLISIFEARDEIYKCLFIKALLNNNIKYFSSKECSSFNSIYKLSYINLDCIRDNILMNKNNYDKNKYIINLCNNIIYKYDRKYCLGSVNLFYLDIKDKIYKLIIKDILKKYWFPTIISKFQEHFLKWTYSPNNPGFIRIHKKFNKKYLK